MATRMFDGARAAGDASKIPALQAAATQAVGNNDIPAAIENFEQLRGLVPGNPDLLSNLGKLYYMSGNLELAIERFGDASTAAPHDEGLRGNYLSALVIAASNHGAAADYPAAIACLRRALANDPGHANARIELATMLELSGTRAELCDFMPQTTPDQLGTHILVACMPKSGSTFLKESLCALTGWMDTPLTYAFMQNEQEVYLPNVLRVAPSNTVTQQHCRATGPNIQIFQAFGFRPIVLVRRLEDIVLSMADFYDSGATTNTFFGDAWPGMDQAAKYDLVIDHVMPWYASFYASWDRAVRLGQLDCLFVAYEDMIVDKPATIMKIAAFLELGKSAEECAATVQAVEADASKIRFNKGVAGRGAAALSDAQKSRLRKLVSTYGDLDLTRVRLVD